ncbi:MAG TPA: hypothetical protein VFQ53_30485 [Kofleriaceae bacterium]|nr:hypothetical protein [Kofleriaceae bacterium]
MMKSLVLGVVIAIASLVAVDGWASPRTDLESPAQATRDTAAAIVRKTWKPTPRSRYAPLVQAIRKPGMTKPKVLALLTPYKPRMEGAGAGGGGETIVYRLDDAWALECGFSERGKLEVLGVELVESVRDVWVEPPKGFTGVWTTYHANGQRSHEIHYKQGTYDGTNTSFHADGSKAVVQTYGPQGAEGDDIGYHPNGKVAYRGTYKAGKQVGTWTWYDEAGKVTSTKQY